MAIVAATRERWWEPELYRLRGQLSLAVSSANHAEAEACFLQALDIARHQKVRSWELRAAISLARLWQQQDKCMAAYDMLAPIFNWFTEGFDTANLQEAMQLLDTLQ